MRRNSFGHFAFAIVLLTSTAVSPLAAQKAVGVQRNSHGRIARSQKAKDEFKKKTGYPRGRPGYVIDHIVPLSRGGSDSPSNMQWQTKEAAKAKDKWERGGSPSGRTYRSRAYSNRAYAPKHRAPRSTYRSYRSYRSPSTRSHSRSYRSYSHRRR